MEAAPINNDNIGTPTHPPTVPDHQLTPDKPDPSPNTDNPSPAPKPSSTGPNGPAKRGIAAAIAAFEKGAGEKSTSPKASPAAVKKFTPATTHPKEPSPSTDHDPPTNQPSNPSPVKPGPAVKKELTTAVKKSEPAPPNRAHPRVSATTTATTKPPVRASTSTRTVPTRTATKSSANPAVSPPVPAPSRRTSIISTVTRVPPKTTTTSAVATTGAARKLPLNTTASIGLRNAQTNLAPGRKLSTAPSATSTKTAPAKPGANASSQATAELENKLSQTELKLAAQTEELTALQARLQEVTESAASAQENLTTEIQRLNAKLEGMEISSQVDVPSTNSADTLDATKADLETAKARITELESLIDTHQKEKADLQNRHSESSSVVAQLEASVKELKEKLDDAVASKEAAIVEVSSQHANELESKLDEARVDFEAKKSALESKLEELERQSQDAQNHAATQLEATLSAELTKNAEEASLKHSEELNAVKTEHASQIETLTNQHESALQSLRETLEAKVAAAEKACAEIEEAAASSDAARKEENAQELAKAVEKAKSVAKEEFESAIAALKEEHNATLAKLETEIAEIKEANSSMNQELEEMKSQNEALNAEKQALEDRLSNELEAVKKEHAAQIQQEYQRAKDELNEGHIDQLKSFRQSSQESTEQLLQSHKAELEAIRSALLSDFASEKATLEAALEQAKLELAASHSDLAANQKSKQDQSSKIDRLTAELETARASVADLEARAKEPVKSDELDELRKALEKANQDAEEQKLLLEKNQDDLIAKFEHAREIHSEETAKHIEEKTLLQKELATIKERLEAGDERVKMSQALVQELSQTIEQEMCKKEELETQLKNLHKSAESKTGEGNSHNTNLIELHEAHNLKILELTNEVEKWKDVAAKKEEEAEEKEFRIKLLEQMIEKDDDDADNDDDENKTRSNNQEDGRGFNENATFVNKPPRDGDDQQHDENRSKIHEAEDSSANDFGPDLAINYVA